MCNIEMESRWKESLMYSVYCTVQLVTSAVKLDNDNLHERK